MKKGGIKHYSQGVLRSVADLVDIAGHLPPSSVIVSGGDRVEDLQLVEAARDNGIVDRIILVGDRDKIIRGIEVVGIDIGRKNIVATSSAEETAAATVELIRSGAADIVLKGEYLYPDHQPGPPAAGGSFDGQPGDHLRCRADLFRSSDHPH